MNWKRVYIIAIFDISQSVFRLKGLVFLIPFFFFWYLILRFLQDNGGELLARPESVLFFSWLLRADIAQKLLLLHPPTLSVFFITMLGTIPFFAMLSGNDQSAGDIGRQSFRYFLTRCTRIELYAGRFVSHYLLLSISILIVIALATLISLKNDQFATRETIEYTVHIYLLILIYILPFVAYMSAISALMSSALSALLMSVTIYIFLLAVGSYITYKFSTDLSLVPSGVKEYMFDINPGELIYAVTGLLAYTFVYMCIGWLTFRNRNI